MNDSEIQKRLLEPFAPNEIEWRIGATNANKTLGIALPYITNRAIQNRLDEVFGIFGWKNEFIVNDKSKICGISIKFDDEWITKYDGADDTNIEGTKGGISNAMKRAAVQWGIGRYLYKLPTFWVEIEQSGKSSKIKGKPPELPNWAMPRTMRVTETDTLIAEEMPIPAHIQDIINAFADLNVNKIDLENYVKNEAFAFTQEDIQTLRGLYKRLKTGKETKADIFPEIEKHKNKVLSKQLEEIK